MTGSGPHGRDWTDDELDLIVADHFAMLADELSGTPFVKAHRARALMERTGRSHRSVEYKHMNLSAVLEALRLPTIRGYRPMLNIQGAIFPAVARYLRAHPDALTPRPPPLLLGLAEPAAPFEGEEQPMRSIGMKSSGAIFARNPPPLGAPRPPRPGGVAGALGKL